MDAEQLIAYEWAKKQNYTSVAAQYAKLLAEAIDKLQADYDKINDFEHSQCAEPIADNSTKDQLIAEVKQLTKENSEMRSLCGKSYDDLRHQIHTAESENATLTRALELMYADNKGYNPDGMGNPAWYIQQAQEQDGEE